MTKELLKEEQMREAINEMISSNDELDGDCKNVVVESVLWNELDQDGCNWHIPTMRNIRGCESFIDSIIRAARVKYNLVEE